MKKLTRGILAVLASVTVVLTVVGVAQAADVVPFTPRFTMNTNGSIVIIGNQLFACPETATPPVTTELVSNCRSARTGGSYDNNKFYMTNLDADQDSSTFSSSMSTLSLPPGAVVRWAGLYWGARLDAGDGGVTANTGYNRMSFRLPGASSYQTITASTVFGPNMSSYRAYQGFADVTQLVSQAGAGNYWGGNVVAGTGKDRYAGWSLVVAYTSPDQPMRNLTIFDGFNMVTNGKPQTIPVSGFRTPLRGPVDVQLGMVVYEGDLPQTGDYAKLNSTQLGTTLSAGSNFFNSTVDLNGVSGTARTPADKNMLGFDLKNLTVSGTVPNGATSATFSFSSAGDTYYPGVMTMAMPLLSPNFTPSAKSVTNLNGNNPAHAGDILQYTVRIVNAGPGLSRDLVSVDAIPAGTEYVPGSLQLIASPDISNPASLTDATGDDLGEFDANSLRVRLGAGAGSSTGGALDVNAFATYSFQVRVLDAASGSTVTAT